LTHLVHAFFALRKKKAKYTKNFGHSCYSEQSLRTAISEVQKSEYWGEKHVSYTLTFADSKAHRMCKWFLCKSEQHEHFD